MLRKIYGVWYVCMCVCIHGWFKTKIILIYYCNAELKPIRQYDSGIDIKYSTSIKKSVVPGQSRHIN